MSNRGVIFAIDAIIASCILLLGLLAFFITLGNYSNRLGEESKNIFLGEKTIFVADSFVKNYSAENSLLGACIIDYEKKRVKSNELSSANFSNARALELDEFFVKSVSIKGGGPKKNVFMSGKNGKNCITIRRFALVDGEKAIVEVQGCLSAQGVFN
jgi:hypothetical protein